MSHVCSCLELSIFRQLLGDTLQNSQFRKKLLLVFLVPDGSLDIIHPAFFQRCNNFVGIPVFQPDRLHTVQVDSVFQFASQKFGL